MLVIPTITISEGKCVLTENPTLNLPFVAPLKLAKLWRIQNACSLWVYDKDAAENTGNNYEAIQKIATELDTPFIASGGVSTHKHIETLFQLGVYRVAVNTNKITSLEALETLLQPFSTSKLVVLATVEDNTISFQHETLALYDFLQCLPQIGCTRIILKWEENETNELYYLPNLSELVHQFPHISFGVITEVSGYQDLNALAQLPPNFNLTILEKSLYEGRFPCQTFWCWHQKQKIDLDCYSTAKLRIT